MNKTNTHIYIYISTYTPIFYYFIKNGLCACNIRRTSIVYSQKSEYYASFDKVPTKLLFTYFIKICWYFKVQTARGFKKMFQQKDHV